MTLTPCWQRVLVTSEGALPQESWGVYESTSRGYAWEHSGGRSRIPTLLRKAIVGNGCLACLRGLGSPMIQRPSPPLNLPSEKNPPLPLNLGLDSNLVPEFASAASRATCLWARSQVHNRSHSGSSGSLRISENDQYSMIDSDQVAPIDSGCQFDRPFCRE